ncbi:hypothetical protein FACS189496_3930 [Bacilli bacterium]|nr:hypothetical protein FACS189496_3930 [Bacilli bacterium]
MPIPVPAIRTAIPPNAQDINILFFLEELETRDFLFVFIILLYIIIL